MTRIIFLAALFLFAAAPGLTADSGAPSGNDAEDAAVDPRPPSTSTYKVRVALNYPGGISAASPVGDDEPVGAGTATGTDGEPAGGDADQEERAELDRIERDRIERDRQEREQAERDRLEREREDRDRADRERAERDQQSRRYRDSRSRSDSDRYGIGSSYDGSNALVTIDEFPTDIFSSGSSSSPYVLEPAVPEKPEPKVLATLNGQPITEDDVSREMWQRRGRETFDWLVGREILKSELERLKLRVDDSEVRDALDKHVEVLRKAYPKLRKKDDLTRAASGMTLDEYRERTVWSELALRKIMRASLETRDEDLRRFFAAVRADYIRPERVRISQIFIPPQTDGDADGIADAEAWARAERQIDEAHAMLRRQEFEDVARLFGSGALVSRWVKRGDLLRELEGPAFSISSGSITTPIRSAMGWHMIKVEEREDRSEPALDELRGEVLARFEEERFIRLAGEFMARLKEKALGSGGLVMVDVPTAFAETTQ